MINEEDENFSGTWVGNCDNEELQLTILQDNEQVTLIFPGYDGKTTSKIFALDKLETHNSSSDSISESTLEHTSIYRNWLVISSTKIYIGDDREFGVMSMELLIIKNGDTISVNGLWDASICELKKIN